MSAATPEHIMKLGTGFWASKALLSAVELGVFSTLAGAPADLPTLRKKARTKSEISARFSRCAGSSRDVGAREWSL
jgi:hypothetical protein